MDFFQNISVAGSSSHKQSDKVGESTRSLLGTAQASAGNLS